MKKIIYKVHSALLACMAMTLILLSACEKNEMDPPMITDVRNYAASPNDTVITSLNDGQWVVLLGENLGAVTQVYFGGVQATINSTLLTDKSIVVQVPSIPFLSVPKDQLHIVTVVSEGGVTNFEINITGAPVIAHVRNHGADSEIIDMVFPEQQINIIGANLENATSIAFQGVEADLSNVVYTDSSAIVQLPAVLSGGDATLVNTITYTNSIGTGAFSIRIVGPPIITRVSYELPKEGDEVYLYGHNFVSVQSVTFAGTTISSFEESEDGTSVKFVAPQLTGSGPVEIETPGGIFTTAYNVNDIATGALSNFEWDGTFKWDWWGGAGLGVEDESLNEGWITAYPEFSGNGSKFLVLNLPVQSADGGAEWSTAIRMTGGNAPTWFPSTANLSDPASSWALKFEINIPVDWNGGTLVIKTSESNYIARYEPWQVTESKTASYKTDGWQTLTIPFTSFRNDNGKGDAITTISDLLNKGSEVSDFFLYLHNYGTADTKTGFKAAFDNFRVVKR